MGAGPHSSATTNPAYTTLGHLHTHTHILAAGGYDPDDMTGKEDYWAMTLVVRRAFDVVELTRQGCSKEYRRKGAAYDAKLAAALARSGKGQMK